jgi:hypothetical protein
MSGSSAIVVIAGGALEADTVEGALEWVAAEWAVEGDDNIGMEKGER